MSYTRANLDEYQRLFELWRDAQMAAHSAAIAIMRDDLDGKAVDAERRNEAGRLAVEAKRLMMETLRAAPPSTRF